MGSLTDCSGAKLSRAAKRLGFVLWEGKKHTKVNKINGEFVTIIPRHSRIKRETARSIVRAGAEKKDVERIVKC